MFSDSEQIVDTPRRRWRFWLLVVGVPLLLLVAAGVGFVIWSNSGLRAAIAEADRLDPRWRMDEIQADRFTPPPGQNAADKIAAVLRHKTSQEWGVSSPAFDAWSDPPPQHQLNDEQIAALKQMLTPLEPALAEARSLIDMPRGRHPITYSPDWISTILPTIQTTRDSASLLKWDVFARTHAGDADGAVRSCHAALNAGTSIGDEPNLISQLVRIACQAVAVNLLERVLAQGEPSEAVLAAIQARLEAIEPETLLVYGLRGDRAGQHQMCESLRNGSITATGTAGFLGAGGNTPMAIDALLHVPGFLASQHAGLLAFMTKMVEIAKRPPEEWAAEFAVQKGKVNDLPFMAKLLVPAMDKMAEACVRNHVILRCAIVAIAAERYRLAKGQWPATPDDLVKAGLLKSVPGDPNTSGQPIKFAKASDGLIVYSVGKDGVDDGGKLDKNALQKGTDYGFRLWDAKARRQPPLPPKAAETDAPAGPAAEPGSTPPR